MKTIKICLLAIIMCTALSCNWRNADNPSNSAPSPESDTATDRNVNLSGGATIIQPDSTSLMDTMPKK
jgi:hypothetical protein